MAIPPPPAMWVGERKRKQWKGVVGVEEATPPYVEGFVVQAHAVLWGSWEEDGQWSVVRRRRFATRQR